MADDNTSDLDTPIASPTTSDDDPLRAWFQQMNDPGMAAMLITDPEKAKDLLAQKGIAPPSGDAALPFADPYGNNIDPATGMPISAPTSNPIVRTNPDGTVAGNVSAPANPDAPQTPAPTPVPAPPPKPQIAAPPTVGGSPLDPEAIGEAAADTTPPKKKADVAGAVGDFSKSLQGVKALQPPALPPVGTPAAPHPNAISAPNIANLLQLAGQTQQGRILSNLGKLLVAGKV